jgi:arylsulfatase A-like enzyme
MNCDKSKVPPNIVFIVADDLGYADLSCCGQTDFTTPHLDRLAAQGIRFTQAYANAPLCTNTRVALMTGQYQYRYKLGLTEPLRHSSRDDPSMGLPSETRTLPGVLKEKGYATSLVGKWHLGALPHFSPLRSGYDEFFGVMGGYTGYFTHLGDGGEVDFYEGETTIETQGYVTDLLSQRAVDTIQRNRHTAHPFFISLHYTAPHWPWSSPYGEADAREREVDLARVADGGSPRIYADMVTCMDRGIGQVMEAIAAAGQDRNTLVIFTSDNGGERYSKNWPFVGRKRDLLEGGLRVPLIVWGPDLILGGRVSDQVCISMDLAATCWDAAQVSLSALSNVDGQSLLPMLQSEQASQDRTLFWRMKDRQQEAIRCGKWKYLKMGDKRWLFDMNYDWRERTNFAVKHPDLLANLQMQWLAWNEGMLPLPGDDVPILVNLGEIPW